ncbi:MAG: hypothetical protein ACLGXA_15375 [Acidobacteriota bacterium]
MKQHPLVASLPATRRDPVAVTFVSKLNGASQPSIVMTTGASLYVAKFREFTGKYGLASEVIGTELMRIMGLPVPKWNPISFADGFLDQNPQLRRRRQPESQGIRPAAGTHFGSLVIRSEEKNPTFEIIPTSWIKRISNRDDFVGTLLLDLWTNNCDRRQCLFLTADQGQTLRAVFIDNDHMFGGFFGNEQTCPRRIIGMHADLYRSVWTEANIFRWLRTIDSIDDSTLDAIFEKVPQNWATRSELAMLRATLQIRRKRLDSMIADVTQTLRTSFRAGQTAPVEGVEAPDSCRAADVPQVHWTFTDV